jgi:uncharacterized membrane protein
MYWGLELQHIFLRGTTQSISIICGVTFAVIIDHLDFSFCEGPIPDIESFKTLDHVPFSYLFINYCCPGGTL